MTKQTLRLLTQFVFPGFLLAALAACGGGGGYGGGGGGGAMQSSATPQNLASAPAPAEPFNIPSATLTASSGGNSYTAIYSQTPNNGTTMFAGQEANSSTISLTITKDGSPVVTEIDTAYYLEKPYQPLGLTLSSNGGKLEFLYNSINPLPSTLTVGGRVRSALGLITFLIQAMVSDLFDQRNDQLRGQRIWRSCAGLR